MLARDLASPLARPLARGLEVPPGGGDGEVFTALQMDIVTKEMRGVIKGLGDLTEARSSTIYQRDWDDIWRAYESNELAWFKGRRVENLCPKSETLASWNLAENVTAVDDAVSVTHNGKTISLSELTDDATDSEHSARQLNLPYGNLSVGGKTVVMSAYVKAGTLDRMGIALTNGHTAADVFNAATGLWVNTTSYLNHGVISLEGGVYFIWLIAQSGVTSPGTLSDDMLIGLYDADTPADYAGSGDTIFVGGVQLQDVSGQPDLVPSEYIRTLTAAVAKTFGTKRRTNQCFSTDDLTQITPWTANSTGTTMTGGVADPDGGNNAFTLSNSAQANGVWRQNRNDLTTAEKVYSFFARRRTGTGTVRVYNTFIATEVFVVTGAWQRFDISYNPRGSTDQLGWAIDVQGDEIDLFEPQLEKGSVFTSYIENPNHDFAASSPFNTVLDLPWLYGGPAGTNELPVSRDLTDPVWVETAGTENDVIVNGDFAADTDWTKGTGWTIAAGVAHCDGSASANTSLTAAVQPLTIGKTYKTTFTISNYSAGQVAPRLGSQNGTLRSANGTFVEYITASGTSCHLRADLDFIGDCDDFQVFEAVAQLDAVGLEGAANTATTLTDDDSATIENLVDTATIPDDSDTHVLRLFIKKDDDETRFPEFQLALLNGTTQLSALQINTKTGALSERTSTGTTAFEVNDNGLLWEVLVSVANNTSGNLTATVTIRPAAGTVIGVLNVAATGSIGVGNVEIHLNKTIEAVRGSTPIFTSGSTVTVDATDLSFDDVNHADLEGAYFVEVKNVGMAGGTFNGMIGVGVNGRILYASTSSRFNSFDGTTVANSPTVTLAADDTEYKLAVAFGDSLKKVNVDDVYGVEVAYDGSYDNGENKLNVLHEGTARFDPLSVTLLRNLRRYDLSYTDAQAKIDELMAA